MSLKKVLADLKKTQMKALKALEKYPKNKDLREMTKLLTNVIKVMKKEIEKEEQEKRSKEDHNILKVIERYVVEIDGHRFIKYESNKKEIEIWTECMLASPGCDEWSFLQMIEIPKCKRKFIRNLESLKIFAEDWYERNIYKK